MMQGFSAVAEGNLSDGRKAPRFTPEERDLIAGWAENRVIKGRGLQIETFSQLYEFLEEALLVSLSADSGHLWLIHKTPDGAVAVRRWPGLADIVPTMSEALAIVTSAVDRRKQQPRRPAVRH
jgi:hypothetical protein